MKRHHIVLLAAGLMALPGIAFANACQSGVSLATILSTNAGVCTIGDLTFDFAGYTPGGSDASGGTGDQNEYSSSAVDFTTISGGFELSGAFSSSSSSSQGYSGGDGILSYTVSVSDGNLTGVATQVNGVSLASAASKPASSTDTNYAGGFAVSANDLYSSVGGYAAEAELSQQSWSGASSTPNPATTSDYSLAGSFAPQPSSAGFAFFEQQAYNETYDPSAFTYGTGGSSKASFTSADFTFATVATPEPGAWLSLLATGLLAIVPIRRLRKRVTA